MFETFRNAWKIEDLRKRLLFTLVILVLFRLGCAIPVPYITSGTLTDMFATGSMLESNLDLLGRKDQLKFVIGDEGDLDYAVGFVRSRGLDSRTNVIFGPVGGTVNLERLVDRVLEEHLDVRVLPQLHKIIWGNRTGVRGHM